MSCFRRDFLKTLRVSKQTKMASISLSPTVATGYVQTKTKTSPSSSAPCPSMAFSIPPIKSSLGSSKSSLFQHGFSLLQSSYSNGRFFKSRHSHSGVYARAATDKTLYDFTVKDIDGKDVPLSKFKGKVLLVVNVASKCGLTASNYQNCHMCMRSTKLKKFYYHEFPLSESYKLVIIVAGCVLNLTVGFEILAFPCNQFGGQEPGSNTEIKQFACTRYKAEYPIFDKVDVNGPSTAPVYQFLKSSVGGFLGDIVKWNFEKFLVDKNGKVVERYPPTTSPFQIEKDIQKLVAA